MEGRRGREIEGYIGDGEKDGREGGREAWTEQGGIGGISGVFRWMVLWRFAVPLCLFVVRGE